METYGKNELNGRQLLESFLNQIGETDKQETTDK